MGYGLFNNWEGIVDSVDSTPVSVIDVISTLEFFYNSILKSLSNNASICIILSLVSFDCRSPCDL